MEGENTLHPHNHCLERASSSKKSFLTFTQSFYFPVKIVLEGNIAKYQTHPIVIGR